MLGVGTIAEEKGFGEVRGEVDEVVGGGEGGVGRVGGEEAGVGGGDVRGEGEREEVRGGGGEIVVDVGEGARGEGGEEGGIGGCEGGVEVGAQAEEGRGEAHGWWGERVMYKTFRDGRVWGWWGTVVEAGATRTELGNRERLGGRSGVLMCWRIGIDSYNRVSARFTSTYSTAIRGSSRWSVSQSRIWF